jgi:hypothetical protein
MRSSEMMDLNVWHVYCATFFSLLRLVLLADCYHQLRERTFVNTGLVSMNREINILLQMTWIFRGVPQTYGLNAEILLSKRTHLIHAVQFALHKCLFLFDAK